MRLPLSLLMLSLSSLVSTSASSSASSSNDVFAKFSASPFPIKTNDDIFFQITSQPRDHSVAMLLTAIDPQYRCAMCREMQPEWDLLAKSWKKGDPNGETRLLFSTLDFTDGKEAFNSLSLQTAPFIMFFPPTKGPHARPGGAPISYDFSTGPLTAEAIHSLITRNFPDMQSPPFKRPVDFLKLGLIGTGLVGGVGALFVAAPYLLPVIQNRNVWAVLCLISILLFTSGQMFNQIRGVPYISGDGRGGISYISGGFQNQLGIETQMVAAIYAVLAFSTIYLAIKAPRIADARKQKASVAIWTCVILCVYSFLLSVFRIKNRGYPFALPPF